MASPSDEWPVGDGGFPTGVVDLSDERGDVHDEAGADTGRPHRTVGFDPEE
jgi:adenylosuccinate synthase